MKILEVNRFTEYLVFEFHKWLIGPATSIGIEVAYETGENHIALLGCMHLFLSIAVRGNYVFISFSGRIALLTTIKFWPSLTYESKRKKRNYSNKYFYNHHFIVGGGSLSSLSIADGKRAIYLPGHFFIYDNNNSLHCQMASWSESSFQQKNNHWFFFIVQIQDIPMK